MLNSPPCTKDCEFLNSSEKAVAEYKEMLLALLKKHNEALREIIELRAAVQRTTNDATPPAQSSQTLPSRPQGRMEGNTL